MTIYSVESVQIRRFFSGPYFSVFGPEKTPYLDTFHAVVLTTHIAWFVKYISELLNGSCF